MFVSNDDYPFFRERPNRGHLKKARFKLESFRNTVSHSLESIHEENSSKMTSKNLKKTKKNMNTDSLMDAIYEGDQNILEINEESLSTLVKYKKLELDNDKKENQIFHLPPLLTKPNDPETTFLTFGELDELNDRIFQNQQISIPHKMKNKDKNPLGLELTYNKTQYQKLTNYINREEKSSYIDLIGILKKSKLKELRTPKIKTFSSQAMMSNGHQSLNFFNEIAVPETKFESPQQIQPEKEKEKEKKNKLKKNYSLENIHFETTVYFYTYEQLGWRPEIRELCTMVLCDKKIYIYSGIGRNIMDDIVAADLGNLTWEKINQIGDVPSYGRYGHTAVLYNKKMYIFGGEKKYNSHLKQHECLNDVRYFSLESHKWKYIRPIGDLVDARRNHVATVVARFMIINGGISPKDQYLNDYWSFDFMINKWVTIPVKGANKNGIAFHSCCSVFLPERNKIVLNKPLESLDDNSNKRLQHEGIYYFGGKNGSYISNELSILLIDQNPMALIKPEISGKPPIPRYGHSMVYNEMQNIVIIYGGRNDYENAFFGDVNILKLNSLCWVLVKTTGVPKAPRASHCSASFNTKLVVFGGLNLEGLTNSEIVMVEFDSSQVKKFVSLESNAKPYQMPNDRINDQVPQNEKDKKLVTTDELKKKAEMLYFEEEEKQKVKKQKMESLMESLKFNNFKSYLPLPALNSGSRRSIIQSGDTNGKTSPLLKPGAKTSLRKYSNSRK